MSRDPSFADDLSALEAASNDSVDGRVYEGSSECLVGNAASTPGDCESLDDTSLRVCVSHCKEAVPTGLLPESSDARGGVPGVVGKSVEDPAPRKRRSFDDSAVQAKVAALLAPGPSGLFRISFPGFSVVRVVRRVVRMGRLSGARGLSEESGCAGAAGALRVASRGVGVVIFMPVVLGEGLVVGVTLSPEGVLRNDGGLKAADGRESSGYVIAGTVPWPIQPRPR